MLAFSKSSLQKSIQNRSKQTVFVYSGLVKTCDELVIGLVFWILSEDIDNRVWPWKDFMTINLISLHFSDFRYTMQPNYLGNRLLWHQRVYQVGYDGRFYDNQPYLPPLKVAFFRKCDAVFPMPKNVPKSILIKRFEIVICSMYLNKKHSKAQNTYKAQNRTWHIFWAMEKIRKYIFPRIPDLYKKLQVCSQWG